MPNDIPAAVANTEAANAYVPSLVQQVFDPNPTFTTVYLQGEHVIVPVMSQSLTPTGATMTVPLNQYSVSSSPCEDLHPKCIVAVSNGLRQCLHCNILL